MPVLDVDLVLAAGEAPPPDLAATLATTAATALDAEPGRTWVRLRTLGPDAYAEDAPLDGAPPVFVSLLLARDPGQDARAMLLARLTTAVADACRRPADRVHVRLEPPAAGRQAFGGRLLDA